ncbi:MAG: SP_1767 family glycosyltransferase [Clostridia bacterium]|nr:SP_1767 family glycosyltransferase [Clostridia bacterium]
MTCAPEVKSAQETLDYIVKSKCSVSRFGDGEIKLVAGKDISFQKYSPFVTRKMGEALSSDETGHIVCIINFNPDERYREYYNDYWKQHFKSYRLTWLRYLKKGKTYYDAAVTRQYLPLKDKSGCPEWFRSMKRIWDDQDVVMVEGERSRLGVGNDLFDNAKSIRRILGPAENAFSKYDELLGEVSKIEKNALIILALGPCASALALDLHKMGFRAIDAGHIDVEYEWFRMGAAQKMPIKNKFVNEARTYNEQNENPEPDDSYYKQIIAKII